MADDEIPSVTHAWATAGYKMASFAANMTPGPVAQFMAGVAGNGFALTMRDKREFCRNVLNFMQDQGFVLSDPISGIYVKTQNKGYRSLGSAVEVRGELAEEHGLLVLRARDIRLKKGHRLISPHRIELSQVDEIREGQIVRLEGEVARPLVNDLPAGYKLFLRGAGRGEVQIFLPPSVRPDPALLTPGRRLEVTGWCAQYNQTYEVIVRSARDLKPSH